MPLPEVLVVQPQRILAATQAQQAADDVDGAQVVRHLAPGWQVCLTGLELSEEVIDLRVATSLELK